jgi:hypothetical protein
MYVTKYVYGGRTIWQFRTGWPLGYASGAAPYEAAQVTGMITKIKVKIR